MNSWNSIAVNGHDIEELNFQLFKAKKETGIPTCLIAKTVKGKGIIGFLFNKLFQLPNNYF